MPTGSSAPQRWPSGRGGGRRPPRLAAAAILVLAAVASGCGSSTASRQAGSVPPGLAARARPIGGGAKFHPPVRGAVRGSCRPRLGSRVGVHVELFAANRVVLIPAGVGTIAPRAFSDGRLTRARCYGEVVTLDPTGLVLVRPRSRSTLADLFGEWGQPLSSRRLGPFSAVTGARVTVFVDGRAWRGRVPRVPLSRHAEIVLEVGPQVPPHSSYAFPPGI